jgi:ribosomal protein L16 Arg81 hydroxylase
MSDSSSIFRRCIQPLDLDTFFSDYWEQAPLIISRGQPHYFSDLLSLDAVDKILTSTNLRVPGFRLVQQGSQIPIREYTSRVSMTPGAFDELIDVDKVYALYQQGATIVLQALERSWEPLIEFCKGVEAYLGHPVQANMYLTPAHAQGFAAHHDTHDTLILQVEGQKHWKVYDMPFPLPLPNQSALPAGITKGEVLHDFVLKAGDTLYMPRGFIHEALTSDSHSMHVTVGIKVWTWIDALAKVVNRALEECRLDPKFRRALPLRFAEESDATLAEGLAPLLDQFREQLRTDGVAELLGESFVSSRLA